jgi:hypothetical protein
LTAGGGQPRFDHNPTTSESLGLEIEEQRTNLITNSTTFDSQTVTNATVFSNAIIAPDGTLTGAMIQDNSTNGQHGVLRTYSVTNGVTYTNSVYLKMGTQRYVSLLYPTATSTALWATFDLLNGTITGAFNNTATITPVGNGWYRVTGTTGAGASAAAVLWLQFNSTGVNPSWPTTTQPAAYAGIGSYFYAWGLQGEAGAFPSSYIATSSAAATRAADVVSMSGANFSSWYSPGNGTFYAEASTASVASDVMVAEATNAAGAFLDFSLTFATTSTQFINRLVASNNDLRRSGAVAANTMVKFSGSLTNSPGTTVGSSAGVAMTVSTSQATNPGADRMFIGSRNGSSLFLNAPIRKLAFYPAQLTQTQQNSITG